MGTAPFIMALLSMSATPSHTGGTTDLVGRLAALRAPGPATVSVRLDLTEEFTLKHTKVKGEASVRVSVDDDGAGLNVRWEKKSIGESDAEEKRAEGDANALTPLRDAMRELDPARISHLLDQVGTVSGLTKGTPVEEKNLPFEGREARCLVYGFTPRVSGSDRYFLRNSEGRISVWIDLDGTPLASESVATFEGKTSRNFGRFKSATTVKTRYAVVRGRLRVAERDMDEQMSRDDGAEVRHTVKHFLIEER